MSDLDGTLLRSDGTLSPSSISVLHAVRRLGAPLVVATARTPRALRKVVGHEVLGRMVCANGAIVWDACSNQVVRETTFDPAALIGAVTRLRRALPEVGFALLSADTMFLDEAYRALRGTRADGATPLSDLDGVALGRRIVSVAVRHPRLTADQLEAATSEAFAGTGVASVGGALVVDVAPTGTTKAVAVAQEMAFAGCPAEATAAFGDMPNDLPLFAWSGWACAVANGHPTVLDAADEIVPSNDDDGVVTGVRRLLALG